MAFPLFSQKIEIIQKKYKIDPGEIATIIKKDKTTAWRWLGKPQVVSESNQEILATAICTVLNKKDDKLKLDLNIFKVPNILNFCTDIGLSKVEAAIFTNQGLPIPDVFIDSVFQYVPGTQRKGLLGSYLLFRHDKEKTHDDAPYLQAYAKIHSDELGRLAYEDSWAGDGEARAQTYEGFVIFVGTITNVVGQKRKTDPQTPTEIFWQGLRRRGDAAGEISHLYGYVSDVTTEKGTLFADRMVLVRVEDKEVTRVRTKKEYYVASDRVIDVAGKEMFDFIEEWRDVPIGEPGQ